MRRVGFSSLGMARLWFGWLSFAAGEQTDSALANGQPDAEGGPLPHRAFKVDASAVFADDPLDNHQAEAAALFLGREKRGEDSAELVFRDAAAGVFDADPNLLGRGAGLKF